MRRNRFLRFVMFLPLVLLFLAVFTFIVMRLWNWLMPPVFGLHVINYWQALGILLLSKILFGGFRGGRPGSDWRWRKRMMERWDQMTPEEQEKFRQQVRSRCGTWSATPPAPEPKA